MFRSNTDLNTEFLLFTFFSLKNSKVKRRLVLLHARFNSSLIKSHVPGPDAFDLCYGLKLYSSGDQDEDEEVVVKKPVRRRKKRQKTKYNLRTDLDHAKDREMAARFWKRHKISSVHCTVRVERLEEGEEEEREYDSVDDLIKSSSDSGTRANSPDLLSSEDEGTKTKIGPKEATEPLRISIENRLSLDSKSDAPAVGPQDILAKREDVKPNLSALMNGCEISESSAKQCDIDLIELLESDSDVNDVIDNDSTEEEIEEPAGLQRIPTNTSNFIFNLYKQENGEHSPKKELLNRSAGRSQVEENLNTSHENASDAVHDDDDDDVLELIRSDDSDAEKDESVMIYGIRKAEEHLNASTQSNRQTRAGPASSKFHRGPKIVYDLSSDEEEIGGDDDEGNQGDDEDQDDQDDVVDVSDGDTGNSYLEHRGESSDQVSSGGEVDSGEEQEVEGQGCGADLLVRSREGLQGLRASELRPEASRHGVSNSSRMLKDDVVEELWEHYRRWHGVGGGVEVEENNFLVMNADVVVRQDGYHPEQQRILGVVRHEVLSPPPAPFVISEVRGGRPGAAASADWDDVLVEEEEGGSRTSCEPEVVRLSPPLLQEPEVRLLPVVSPPARRPQEAGGGSRRLQTTRPQHSVLLDPPDQRGGSSVLRTLLSTRPTTSTPTVVRRPGDTALGRRQAAGVGGPTVGRRKPPGGHPPDSARSPEDNIDIYLDDDDEVETLD